MEQSWSRGFTLVELLVVIFIIGVLATLMTTNFVGIRDRAQDSKIKADLNQLKKALRLYYNDHQSYPAADGSGNIVGCGAAGATTCSGTEFGNGAEITYMKELPENYQYYSNGDEEFLVVVTLNNASDEDITASQSRCSPDSRTYFDGGPISTTEYVICED